MNRWAIYAPDGRIDRIYSGSPQEAALQPQGDEDLVPIYGEMDDATAYVADGEVLARQPFPFTVSATQIVADGGDTAAITGVPAGTSVRWPDGQVDEVTDGVVEFSVDLPGTYTLRFTAIPYLDAEVTIEAVLPA
ncbi:hypothetical protein NLU14_08550 [Marinobacter sp. 71-i]|uniref:Uncharacterized protein n=1 Tax=Marinobacter iranensis TaxID=2962607 RepID=A0ABT5Y9E0_9GAMM|nr:hypothetical protein [Marinobacter iranensis]MDF0750278.1 hypothetical protein [Marinobacter iranensis]